ncbi:Hypothetical predicted protein [Olea europaea subsp. europaea]|uniref:Uncharacterized protein n=1 Tax=Olea europaea subsp. europaea TaxID=158383 RepID=A0A8S0PGJ8_OLEEU|nr:Hypothetical predicted protein [Olea europaea subsp. europaea]
MSQPKAIQLYHLTRGFKIDLGALIYDLICFVATDPNPRHNLIFPRLITGICHASGIRFLPGELPTRAAISINASSITKTWQSIRQQRQRRQQQQDQGDPEADDHVLPPVEPEPAPNLHIMRQLFAGLVETNRTLQRISQMMIASQVREQARDDIEHARNIKMKGMERDIGGLLSELLTLHREHDLIGRCLDRYTGRSEDMHIPNEAIHSREWCWQVTWSLHNVTRILECGYDVNVM